MGSILLIMLQRSTQTRLHIHASHVCKEKTQPQKIDCEVSATTSDWQMAPVVQADASLSSICHTGLWQKTPVTQADMRCKP